MTNLFRVLTLGVFAVTLAACAATPTQENGAVAAQQATEIPNGATALPEVQLDADLLYQLLLAEIAGQRGELNVAVANYLAAARVTRDPRIAERATRIAVFARDEPSALAAAQIWVAADPQSLDARQMLAAFLIRQGQGDVAVEHLNYLLSSDEVEPEKGFLLIANLLVRDQDKDRALATMRELVTTHGANPYAWYAYSYLAEHAGDMDTARQAIEQALTLKPDWPSATTQYARVLLEQEETDQALAVLEQALRQHPDETNLRMTYARMLVEAKRLDDARAQFEILAKQTPDDGDIIYALGILALQAEDLDGARRYFVQLTELGTREMEARYYLGQIEETRKDYPRAIAWYGTVNRGEHYLDAQIRIAAVMVIQGDIDGARRHLNEASTSSAKERVRLYLAESDILREANQYGAALEVFDRALEEFPGDTELLYGRSLIAEKLDRLDLAEQDLRTILDMDPNNAHALNALGYTLADRTTRYNEALGYIERALELRPHDPAIIDSMGWVQYRLGNYDEAVKYLRRALELSGDAEIAAHLGEVLWVMGDVEGARSIWAGALKSSPDDELLLEVMKRFEQ